MEHLLNRVYTVSNCVLVAALLLKNHYAASLSDRQHRWIDRGTLLAFAVLVGGTVWVCASNVIHPRPWDYPSFYTVARAIVTGQAFYDPEVLKATFRAVNVDGIVPDEWFAEPYYLYLPPSALLLAPLGLLEYRQSLVLHYVIQGAFLAGTVLLLHRLAPARRGWRGAIEIAILMLAFRPVQAAFNVAQIVFGALFFTVLALIALPTRPIVAGAALAIGALYKHLLLIVALLASILRRLSTSLAFTVAIGITIVLSLLAFGTTSFTDFAAYGPSARPSVLHLDPVNQSLLATLHRLLGEEPEGFGVLGPVLFPPFVVTAGLLSLATGLLCRFGRRQSELTTHLRAALLVSLALLLYPHTLYNTIPLVLPGLVIAFSFRDRLPVPGLVVVGFVTTAYAAASIPEGGGFVSVLVSWLGLASLLLALQLRPQM